jgi:hypothetical protein
MSNMSNESYRMNPQTIRRFSQPGRNVLYVTERHTRTMKIAWNCNEIKLEQKQWY